MLSIRLITLSPPFSRGLKGANKGLGSAYRWGPSLSEDLKAALVGVATRLVGKVGKAESMLRGKSGDGGPMGRGTGLVALLFIL